MRERLDRISILVGMGNQTRRRRTKEVEAFLQLDQVGLKMMKREV